MNVLIRRFWSRAPWRNFALLGRAAIALAGLVAFEHESVGRITISWTDNSIDESGFKIERAAVGDGFVQIGMVGADVVAYTDDEAVDGTGYSYRVRAYNDAGESPYSNIASTAAMISTEPLNPPPGAPGGNAAFTVGAGGAPQPAIQWQLSTDGGVTWTDLSDAGRYSGVTTMTLSITAVPSYFDGYRYRAVATNSFGTAISNAGVITIESRLTNISVLAPVGSSNSNLILGFVIGGGPTKPLLVRGIGPALGTYGVPGSLGDPTLSLYGGSQLLESNDDWGMAPNANQIASTSARLGGFPLPQDSRDAALLSVLDRGDNTVQLSGKGASSGLALIELYDADPFTRGRLVNVSARTNVGTGANAPVIGFVIAGNLPKKLLIRVVGPALQSYGMQGLLDDPQLTVFRQGETAPLYYNDNWDGTAALKSAFRIAGAFALEDSSRDASLLVQLEPGSYTAQVSGINSTTGAALIELYEMP
jgi:hypothetical protein